MGSALNIAIGAPYIIQSTAALTANNTTLSTLNTKIGAVLGSLMCSGSSATITHVGYRQGVTTGTPAGSSYKIGLQGVDSSGNPDGTYLGGGSPASATFTPAGANDGTWVWVALANSVAVNRESSVALVLERVAATDAGNCISAASSHARLANRTGVPYALTHNATSWTKITGGDGATAHHCMGLKSASEVFGYPAKNLYVAESLGSTTEKGFAFTLPTDFCSTYKVKGVRLLAMSGSSGSGTRYATLYSSPTSSPAILNQSNARDNDVHAIPGNSVDRPVEYAFSGTLATLTAGTEYGIGFATTSGSDMEISCMEVSSVGDFDAWPFGQQAAYMTRTLTDYPPSGNDSNNFTKTTTKRVIAELILDDLTPPAGGGSTTIRGGAMFCG